jgi:hypothetical protein
VGSLGRRGGGGEGGRRGFVLRACCLIMVTYLWPNNTPRQISLVRFCYCCLVLGARDGFFFLGGVRGAKFPILGKWEREHVGYWPHMYIQMSRHVRLIVRNLQLSWFCFFFLGEITSHAKFVSRTCFSFFFFFWGPSLIQGLGLNFRI